MTLDPVPWILGLMTTLAGALAGYLVRAQARVLAIHDDRLRLLELGASRCRDCPIVTVESRLRVVEVQYAQVQERHASTADRVENIDSRLARIDEKLDEMRLDIGALLGREKHR